MNTLESPHTKQSEHCQASCDRIRLLAILNWCTDGDFQKHIVSQLPIFRSLVKFREEYNFRKPANVQHFQRKSLMAAKFKGHASGVASFTNQTTAFLTTPTYYPVDTCVPIAQNARLKEWVTTSYMAPVFSGPLVNGPFRLREYQLFWCFIG